MNFFSLENIPDKNKIASGLIPEKSKDYPNPLELLGDLIDVNYSKNLITKSASLIFIIS